MYAPYGVVGQSGQLTDSAAEAALVDGVDAVVHDGLLWPRQHPRQRLQNIDFGEFARVNLLGTLQLVRTAHQAGAGRFIFISTCAVHEIVLDDRGTDDPRTRSTLEIVVDYYEISGRPDKAAEYRALLATAGE